MKQLRLIIPYYITSSFGQEEEEENSVSIITHKELEILGERVAELETRIVPLKRIPLSVVSNNDLYAARIDYSNDVVRQWDEIKELMDNLAFDRPIILNKRILPENAVKLASRGIKAESVPFTHYTMVSYVGRLTTSDYLDMVD